MKKMIVFDTETGGFDPAVNSILSIGMVVWNNGAIEDRLRVIVREDEINAEAQALKVNGLTLERIRTEGVSPYDAVIQINQMLLKHDLYKRRLTLAGHHVAFDIGFLKRLYRLAGLTEDQFRTFYSHRSICTQTLAIALELVGRVKWHSTGLDSLTRHFGIQIGEGARKGKHDSLEDAEATALLLNKLLVYIKNPEIPVKLTQVEIPEIVDPGSNLEATDGF